MINELEKKYFQELEEKFPEVFNNFTIEKQLQNNPFRKFYTVSVDKKIIGFISFDMMYERAEIININITKEYENKGYGTLLMKFLIECLESNNVESITLEVKIGNNNAIHLYEKFGFKKIAYRKKYYDGTDAILMERKMI